MGVSHYFIRRPFRINFLIRIIIIIRYWNAKNMFYNMSILLCFHVGLEPGEALDVNYMRVSLAISLREYNNLSIAQFITEFASMTVSTI